MNTMGQMFIEFEQLTKQYAVLEYENEDTFIYEKDGKKYQLVSKSQDDICELHPYAVWEE